jgi:hypothetical protein
MTAAARRGYVNFFVVPAGTPHAGGKNGDKMTRITSTYVVEKGKPLASPA